MKPDNRPKKKCDSLIKSKPNEGLMEDKETERLMLEREREKAGALLGLVGGAVGGGSVGGVGGAILGTILGVIAIGAVVAVINNHLSKKAKTTPICDKETIKALPPSNTPPKTAEYLLYLLVPRKNRDALLGDLQEDFNEVREKFGLRQAKIYYWVQVLRSIQPLLKALIISSVFKYIKSTI